MAQKPPTNDRENPDAKRLRLIAPYLRGAILGAVEKGDFPAVGVMLTANPGLVQARHPDVPLHPSFTIRAEEPPPLAAAADFFGQRDLAKAIATFAASDPETRVWRNPGEAQRDFKEATQFTHRSSQRAESPTPPQDRHRHQRTRRTIGRHARHH